MQKIGQMFLNIQLLGIRDNRFVLQLLIFSFQWLQVTCAMANYVVRYAIWALLEGSIVPQKMNVF